MLAAMSTLVGMSPATPADLTGAKVKKKFAGYGDVVWNGEVVQMVGKGMFRVYWFDGEGNVCDESTWNADQVTKFRSDDGNSSFAMASYDIAKEVAAKEVAAKVAGESVGTKREKKANIAFSTSSVSASTSSKKKSKKVAKRQKSTASASSSDTISCPRCTLVNNITQSRCEACGKRLHPKASSESESSQRSSSKSKKRKSKVEEMDDIDKFFAEEERKSKKQAKASKTSSSSSSYSSAKVEEVEVFDIDTGKSSVKKLKLKKKAGAPQPKIESLASLPRSSPKGKKKTGLFDPPTVAKRERSKTTMVIDGYVVKKVNNYTVSESQYHYGELPSYEDEQDTPKQRKVKTKKEKKPPTATQIKKAKEREGIKEHNESVKSHNSETALQRKAFFKSNLDIFKVFLEKKKVKELENFTPPSDLAPPPNPIMIQPSILQGDMRDYQLEGLNFMAKMHHHGCPCILGDEMGLGKTLQTISLLCHLKENLRLEGPSLIVCPLSVLSSWMHEFKKWAPSLKVMRLHASETERDEILSTLNKDFIKYDAIVTTYEMTKAKGVGYFFSRAHFRYVVLDEGHIIKNRHSQISEGVRRIHSQSRLILTGTPTQNNLTELWALLNYLVPDYFEESEAFDNAFDIGKQLLEKDTLVSANMTLGKFMLRRMKSTVEKLMPLKIETQIACPLSKMQIHWYKSLLMKDLSMLAQLSPEEEGGGPKKEDGRKKSGNATQYKRLNNLVMQLRKCALHPFLFDGAEQDIANTTLTDLVAASGKLSMLDKLLVQLFKGSHRACIFSQFTQVLDIIEDYCLMRGWKYSRLDGSVGRAQRSYIVDRFNAPDSPEFLFLMSTRAGGMGLNLQTADTVILYDSDWNPQPDLQAMARVHRIGQKKTVHVYRLVTTGTVEERVVQRAQKKLYLDKMVNSTEVTRGDEEGDREELMGGMGVAEMLECLSFGSDAVFGGSGNQIATDEEIAAICDRTRDPAKGEQAKALKSAIQTNKDFEALDAFTETQAFKGVDFKKLRDQQAQNKDRLAIVNFADIANNFGGMGKRVSKKTVEMVDASGSGYGSKMVPVMKANMYDLQSGETSVFTEMNDKWKAIMKDKKKEVVKRKIDFVNQDFCQACNDGGSLICCDKCPVSCHPECYGYSKHQLPNTFTCSHHKCAHPACGKTVSNSGGLLYRCDACPDAFCDEHLPKTAHLIFRSLRHEQAFYHSKDAAYMHCNDHCRALAIARGWVDNKDVRQRVPFSLDLDYAFGETAEQAGDAVIQRMVSVSPVLEENSDPAYLEALKTYRKLKSHTTAADGAE
ncbi:hypothetical protein TrVE_jg5295 [Triparma verrucosa]|uniref:Uncharacterized protein n=1 Tax=Triparma verrucosa TaxID=1606542 RepID=A0A9W7FNS0_9STRA|nr:hypothetical protein TrVE_jg5295 [Triparma verrucosa]